MAHRMIRDTILTSPTLAGLSAEAERFFYRLLTVADDVGRFDADPCLLLAQAFPRFVDGRIAIGQVAGWIDDLEGAGIIRRYAVASRTFGYFLTWERHQRFRHPRESRIPAPPRGHQTDKRRTSSGQATDKQRTSDGTREGKRREEDQAVESMISVLKTPSDRFGAETAPIDRVGSNGTEGLTPDGTEGNWPNSPELASTGKAGASEGQDKGAPEKTQGRAGSGPSRRHRGAGVTPETVRELFDRFWRAYPRKVGKANAGLAFIRALDRESDIAGAAARMLAAVERDRKTRQWADSIADRADPCGKVPHPATWLNQRRWEDEPALPAPRALRLGEHPAEETDPEADRRMAAARRWIEVVRVLATGRAAGGDPLTARDYKAMRAAGYAELNREALAPEGRERDAQRARFIAAWLEAGAAP